MLKLFEITKRFFTQKTESYGDLPSCFAGTDADTEIPAIHYLTTKGQHYIIDGNSIVTLNQLSSDRVIEPEILETSQAESIKREVVDYYKTRNKKIPTGFSFLRIYQDPTKKKPLFH